MFLPRFELVVARFGPPKIPKRFDRGLFWDKNGSKVGQQCVFRKMILYHFGCLTKWNAPLLSPLQPILAPPKSQNTLKMGCFGTKNQSKMDEKSRGGGSQKSDILIKNPLEPKLKRGGVGGGFKGGFSMCGGIVREKGTLAPIAPLAGPNWTRWPQMLYAHEMEYIRFSHSVGQLRTVRYAAHM